MPILYFKRDTSEPVQVACTSKGRIDFSALGRKLKFDPSSIELNGVTFPLKGLKSDLKWEQMKGDLNQDGRRVGTKEDPVIVSGEAPVRAGTPKIDNTLSIRKAIVQQRVRICSVDELPGLLETELEDGLRFPVTSDMWNDLPPNKGKLFKLAEPNEECYRIFRLVDAILNPTMPKADTEDSYHRFWDTVIEEPLKFFFDGEWLPERNKSGEGIVSGTRPNMVVRFRFQRYGLWKGKRKALQLLVIQKKN